MKISDSKVPPILAQSGEKMNFEIEQSYSTLTWAAGVEHSKINAIVFRLIKLIMLNIGW
jgi:hypothetical protein